MEKVKLSKITCPTHTKEKIARISMSADTSKEIYCIECLLEFENDKSKISKLKQVPQFIKEVGDFYATVTVKKEESDEEEEEAKKKDLNPPEDFVKLMAEQTDSIGKLTEQVQEQKKKVEESFDALVKSLTETIQKKKEEVLKTLDAQVSTLTDNYAFLEKHVKNAYGIDDPNIPTEVVLTKENIAEKLGGCTNAQSLIDLLKVIRRDFDEEKKLNPTKTGAKSTANEKKDQAKALIENLKTLMTKSPVFSVKDTYATELATLTTAVEKLTKEQYEVNGKMRELKLKITRAEIGCGKCGVNLVWFTTVYGGSFSCNRCYTTFSAGCYHCVACQYDSCKTCYERDAAKFEPCCTSCGNVMDVIESETTSNINCKNSCRSYKDCTKYYKCSSHDNTMCEICAKNIYFED